jgi:xanthine dehydrogenase accessory factor
MLAMEVLVLVRGAGDLASGVALRLHRCGFQVIMTELPQPLVVRRTVSFAEAIYHGEFEVEGAIAQKVDRFEDVAPVINKGRIPLLVDPDGEMIDRLREVNLGKMFFILVDARMTKKKPERGLDQADLVIGLGPGFTAGLDCHAVVETLRGHFLGRVIWNGCALPNTGVPESVGVHAEERVLRSPIDGMLNSLAKIGDHISRGQAIAIVDDYPIKAPFGGMLRGLLHPGVAVTKGMKIGDLDPRDDPRYCWLVSDKSLAIGGGVLEAVLTWMDVRRMLLETWIWSKHFV